MGIKISDMSNLTGSKLNDNSFLLVTDLSGSTVDLQNRKVTVATFNQVFSNNKLFNGLSSYENFFGTGEDGDVTFSSNTNITSDNNGEIVVKQYKSCSINLGVTVTTSNPCRGLVIFCTGDLTVDGTLTMTAKGGGAGNNINEFNYINVQDTSLSFNTSSNGGLGVQSWNFSPSGSVWFPKYRQTIPLRNPVAGAVANSNGIAGVFSCGGGGGGTTGATVCPNGTSTPSIGGFGGSGSLFAGGGGGGGGGSVVCAFPPSASSALGEIGGNGSAGIYVGPSGGSGGGGGGGAGNPAGTGGAAGSGPSFSTAGSPGSTGVGGLLILIVRGNVSITGTISSNGSSGGAGGAGSPAAGSPGGGSGGGRIIIIYGGTYSNTGTIQANGGGAPGTSGGAGSITVQKVDQ